MTRLDNAQIDPVDEVRELVREWICENWSTDITLRQWWGLLAESGWGYPSWPRRWFGLGLDRAASAAVDEEMRGSGVIAPPSSGGQRLAGPTILAHGSDEQRDRLLAPLARGEEAWCQLFSEPDAGSDLAGLRSRATREGDGWRINGQKVWTSGAQVADRAFLLARTGTQAERHRGLTYFIVDLEQPGVTVRPLRQITGESAFNQVFLDDVFVSDRDVIGSVGGGWPVALTTLGMERFATRSSAAGGYHWSDSPLGVPGRKSASLDTPVEDLLRAAERAVAPRTDIDAVVSDLLTIAMQVGQLCDPHVRASLVDLYVRSRVLREARTAASAGDGRGAPNGSVRKLLRSSTMAAARDAAVALMPNIGPGDTAVLEAIILSSPASSVAGGTDEIQRNVIAERVLGMPRAPRVEQEG